ncbi:MAG TPA: hypothetical protein VH988_07610 [Thermoanaerobaculia bacterium]|jgi:hypothetical protein|nr:hypothetical protein [Thermoanaerobaculia bacterium]
MGGIWNDGQPRRIAAQIGRQLHGLIVEDQGLLAKRPGDADFDIDIRLGSRPPRVEASEVDITGIEELEHDIKDVQAWIELGEAELVPIVLQELFQ